MLEVSVKTIVSQLAKGCIFTGECRAGKTYRIRVAEPLFPAIGEAYEVEGEQTKYRDRYGRNFYQISASKITRISSSGRLLATYLTTLTGVGETRARRLLEKFGDQTHKVLIDPKRLEEIARTLQPGRPILGRKLAAVVQAEYVAKVESDQLHIQQFEFLIRLERMGVTDRTAARKLWSLIGSSTAGDALIANPYLAAALIDWPTADSLGKAILRSLGTTELQRHPERLLGAVDAATRKLLATGHTAASESRWKALAPNGVSGAAMLSQGLESGSLISEGSLVRPLGARYLEQDTARLLRTVAEQGFVHDPQKLKRAVEHAERAIHLALTEEQRRVVIELLGRPLAVLQGGAGVGKTTVMAVILESWQSLGGNVLMAALSGKAALQLSRATSRSDTPNLAVTIARLISGLRAVKEGKTDEGYPQLSHGTLIILDEASMIDTPLLHELLTEVEKFEVTGIRFLFVGDSGQLPPVGFGAVFHHLAETAFASHLTKPLRQVEGSIIPRVAAQIRAGAQPAFRTFIDQMEGIHFLDIGCRNLIDELTQVYSHVRSYCDVDEVMVCAAKNATVSAFNKRMAAPYWEEAMPLGLHDRFFPGAPIICTKNHYKHGLFNGALGIVQHIDGGVFVAWDGDRIDPMTEKTTLRLVPQEVSLDVRLAYSITCHKSQGSAAKAVIVALEETKLQTREWLYTAVTRARQQVIIVGRPNELSEAIRRRTSRITGFSI